MKKQEKKPNNIKTNGTERNAKEGIPVALHLSQKKKLTRFQETQINKKKKKPLRSNCVGGNQ